MKAVLLKLNDQLADQIDQARGDVPRTVWITRACEGALERLFQATLDYLPQGELEVAHRDGNSQNNDLTNLEMRAGVGSIRKRMVRDGKSGAPMQVREKLVRYEKGEPVWKVEG